MRVANLIEEGKLGGPQVRIATVAEALRGQVDTTVIMPEENSAAFRIRCDAAGIPYRTFALTRITKEWRVALRYVLFSAVEVLRLAREFRRERYDIVHVSGGSWQFKGVIAGSLAGTKVLWHLNDTSMPGFIRRLFSMTSRLADGFIFASERTREYYRPLMRGSKPEFVIPAPVDGQRFDPQKEYPGDEDLIRRWADEVVVGTVGNVNPVKGIELLLQIAGLLRDSGIRLRFVVVGPVFKNQERYFLRLEALARELGVNNVEFVGGRADVRPLLKRFDIYVCTSVAESSPIAVWEAMSMGKAVVSTDVGDVSRYVTNGENGYVVAPGDVAGIAARVRQLAENVALRRELGSRARQVVLEALGVDRCAELHVGAYRGVLQGTVR